jgi:hypothetical protein
MTNTGETATPVIALRTYALARRAAVALRGLLHEPAWLVSVKVEFQPNGDPVVVALVRERSRRTLICFPSSIDGVEVVVRGAQRRPKENP